MWQTIWTLTNITIKLKRDEIAGKLSEGISIDRILNGIRDIVSTKINRIHLLSRKDIVNIEKAHGLKGVEHHPNDSMNVALWVEEISQKGADNPVLLKSSIQTPMT